MPRQFENRVKVYQIIESQLPSFIRDNVITKQEIQSTISGSGSYVRSGKTVTITSINHGLEETDRLKLEYISGSGTDGFYSVTSVINQNTFTVEDEISGKTSGTVNYEQYSTVVGLEQSNIRSIPGNYDKFIEFLKQYYISQEYQSSSIDLIDNLDQYLNLDNLIPEVIVGSTTLTSNISSDSKVINVETTKGFPDKYGLIKIDDEIITYTEKTEKSFIGCIRGFSGITNYHQDFQPEELVFSESDASSHLEDSTVENLSVLFLKEFYKKIKYSLVPGLEDREFVSNLNVGNFIKEARSLYETKGTEESFRILFNILFGVNPRVIDLEQYLFKPSDAKYIRREVSVVERISGNPLNLRGQTVYKTGDSNTYASVSEIEPITKSGKTYYKLFLFIGYDDASSSIFGNFNITPSTKVSSNNIITKNSSEIVSVDSTVGFPESGYFIFNNRKIFYSEKTINQFFGCYTDSDNSVILSKQENITTGETYYGFENGDANKKVEIRFTGVLTSLTIKEDENPLDKFNYIEGDEIFVKNLGEVIQNNNDSRKEIISNSWIYNTNCRFEIDSNTILGNQFNVLSDIDKSSLSIGDYIEFLERGTELTINGFENVLITNILNKTISVNQSLSPPSLLITENYDIRRVHKKASSSSSIVPLKYGNNSIISDILNTYNEKNESLYVASNSLPSYQVNPKVYVYEPTNILESSYNPETEKYSVLEFDEILSFLTGDRIYYKFSNSPIEFLEERDYYVQVLSNKRQIRLYTSLSLVGSDNYLEFSNINRTIPSGTHRFVLYEQRDLEISPQKLLRKFKISPKIDESGQNEVISGPIGMLVNGVEILSYKTNDKVYYGPIQNVKVLNVGSGYDVINPPLLELSTGNAKLQPVISGSVEKVLVDLQTFDINVNVSVEVSGGNGSGAEFEPIIVPFQREISFDARQIENGGGIDFNLETISFLSPHNLVDGQVVIYDKNGNEELGIGTYFGVNSDTGSNFVNGGEYYIKVFNDTTVQIYPSFSDFSVGINTIGITSIGNRGIHKFKTVQTNRLKEILVLNGGSGYTNRKLRVKSVGISTSDYSVNFINHGFNDGDVIDYSYENSQTETSSIITGLSTSIRYNILKIDNNKFRLCDAGIGGTNRTNFERKKYVKFTSTGSGYQVFKYPDISLTVNYSSPGIGSTSILGTVSAIPIVRGSIEDVYVYESGVGYGSTIINLKSTPKILLKNGSSAQFRPIIVNGEIVDVQVQYGGVDYYSYPDINVVGSGSGAILRPIIQGNKIIDVVVIDSGSGYNIEDTVIIPFSAGINAKFDLSIRGLTINNSYKFGNFIEISSNNFFRVPSDEIISESSNNTLQYYISGYSSEISSKFNDTGINHSPIIGWAYDGNPIYGPYGYTDPEDPDSPLKLLESGYIFNSVENRPSGFDNGFFVEDYIFDDSGDLDEYNGRFCKTPEFPNGTYAYFSTVESNPYDSSSLIGKFPYFVGNFYRSNFNQLENLLLNQNFDFNSSNLIRNTLPYKVSDPFAKNDFIVESNEIQRQKLVIESINSGDLSGFNIINPGDGYKVSDRVIFNDIDENSTNIIARVSELKGKEIANLNTVVGKYENSIITWIDNNKIKVTIPPSHDLENNDRIIISDLSEPLSKLSKEYKIGITTYVSNLVFDLGTTTSTGIVTDIVLTNIPTKISVGSSIKIQNEILSVLGVYDTLNTLRVYRTSVGISHTDSAEVYFIPDSFLIDEESSTFNSTVNDKIYFNPQNSVGVGTTPGSTYTLNYYIGKTKVSTSVPIQSIYIPNHPFKTSQKVLFKKQSSNSSLLVSENPNSGIFNLPLSGNSQEVYVINKSKDYIGIVTSLDAFNISTTTNYYSNGLFFFNNGDNSEFYSIESTFDQEKCTVERFKTTVTLKSAHSLRENDNIDISLKTNSDNFTTFNVKYIQKNNLLLLEEKNISSLGINTSTNVINLPLHGYLTGDKVYYRSEDFTAGGLTEGEYFIFKVDDDNFKLTETLADAVSENPTIVGIASTGGSGQLISKINPPLNVIKNNKLIFDLSHSSLAGYNMKIFYDNDFKKEFKSVETLNNFSISGIGTVGISTEASLSIEYSDTIPEKLFYTIEKDSELVIPDKNVKDFSTISFVESEYVGNYKVYNTQGVGIGSTAFNISLRRRPESLYYDKSDCDVLEYTTNSTTDNGGIHKIKIFNKSSQYKKVPTFSRVDSANGVGAYLIPQSKTIGTPKETRIVVNGFDYPSDKTLRPEASLPLLCSVKNNQQISKIEIINAGINYLTPPDLIVINPETSEIIDNGILRASLSGVSVGSVEIEVPSRGLPATPATIKAINNTNGISISQVQSSSSGIVTCLLTTPISGFGTDPFTIGDKIFVEGIIKDSTFGTGFNSSDYNYQFFTVSNYVLGSNPGKLEYNLSSFTANPGIAKTIQDSFASIIKQQNYPQFKSIQTISRFFVGEKIYSDKGFGFELRDLVVKESTDTFVRLFGTYELEKEEIIRGSESFNLATVDSIKKSSGRFEINSFVKENIGWSNDTGKIGDSFQVIPDNDYYQNLSYTVKSTKTWQEIVSPVNSLLHTSGLKNFSDTEFIETVVVSPNSGISTARDSDIVITRDFIEESRVDTINNFDLVIDVDISQT